MLRPLVDLFPPGTNPELAIGLADPDDAAVLVRSPEEALIMTVDFFPPVVDDPFDFGVIAAANAMSDVFAMGGEVVLALNVAGFPEEMPADAVEAIIRGGAETVLSAGGVIAGGHTVIDLEPKYGLAVLGRAKPDALLRKGGAKPGDRLILTKPLGSGLVTTALKSREAAAEHVAAAVAWMSRLNLGAGRAAAGAGANAATDVSGFGLAGHGVEMARASGARLVFEFDALPVMDGASEYLDAGNIPGGTRRNESAFEGLARGADVARIKHLVFDPQTSGGLLISVADESVATLRSLLAEAGDEAWEVGRVEHGDAAVVFR